MGRPRKDPTDPKWAVQTVEEPVPVPVQAPNESIPEWIDELILAVLMAGLLARGGTLGYDATLRQAKELAGMIKADS